MMLEQLVIHTHTHTHINEPQPKPHTLHKTSHKMDHRDKYNRENHKTFRRKHLKKIFNMVKVKNFQIKSSIWKKKNTLYSSKFKTSALKTPFKRMKRQATDWRGKNLQSTYTPKDYVSGIYEDLSKLHS